MFKVCSWLLELVFRQWMQLFQLKKQEKMKTEFKRQSRSLAQKPDKLCFENTYGVVTVSERVMAFAFWKSHLHLVLFLLKLQLFITRTKQALCGRGRGSRSSHFTEQ